MSGRLKVRWQSVFSCIAISCALQKYLDYFKVVPQLRYFSRLTRGLCAAAVTVNILSNNRVSLPKAFPQWNVNTIRLCHSLWFGFSKYMAA